MYIAKFDTISIAVQVYGLRLVGLLQAALPSTNGSLSAEQHVPPEQLRDVVVAASSSSLQCVAADAGVLSGRGGPAGVACCRLSCHCRALHEGATLEVSCIQLVTPLSALDLATHVTCHLCLTRRRAVPF